MQFTSQKTGSGLSAGEGWMMLASVV